jgi:hypothetical protein
MSFCKGKIYEKSAVNSIWAWQVLANTEILNFDAAIAPYA